MESLLNQCTCGWHAACMLCPAALASTISHLNLHHHAGTQQPRAQAAAGRPTCSPTTKPRAASMATRPWVSSDSRQRLMSEGLAVRVKPVCWDERAQGKRAACKQEGARDRELDWRDLQITGMHSHASTPWCRLVCRHLHRPPLPHQRGRTSRGRAQRCRAGPGRLQQRPREPLVRHVSARPRLPGALVWGTKRRRQRRRRQVSSSGHGKVAEASQFRASATTCWGRPPALLLCF